MGSFIAAAVQFGPESLKVDRNVARMVDLIGGAAAQGARLVVLPELADSGYVQWPRNRAAMGEIARIFEAAAPVPGRSTEALAAAAKRHGVYVCAGLLEADPAVRGRVYNASVLIGPDGAILGRHRKVTAPVAEMFYFVRGNALDVFPTAVGRIGLSVCYDCLFPENGRVQTLKGMEVHCVMWSAAYPDPPTIPADSRVPNGFPPEVIRLTPILRAVENCVYVVSANRVGFDDFSGGRFIGESVVVAPWGEILAEAGRDSERIITAEVDLGLLDTVRACRPMLKDRRPDLYGILGELP